MPMWPGGPPYPWEPGGSWPGQGATSQPQQDPSQPIGSAAPGATAVAPNLMPGPETQNTLKDLIAKHGALKGPPAPVTFKDAISGAPKADPSGAQTYTFDDGYTAVVGQKGELGPIAPPKAPANVQAPDTKVIGGTIYTQRRPTDPGYDPNDPNTWWQKSVVDQAAQNKANADLQRVLTQNGLDTATATSIALKTPAEIQEILGRTQLSDAQKQQVLNNIQIANATLPGQIAKTAADTAQAQATAGQITQATQIAQQKAPGEMAKTDAETLETLKRAGLTDVQAQAALQGMHLAAAPTVQAPQQGLYTYQRDPTTGAVTPTGMNPEFIPKTQQDVAARAGQLQQIAREKGADLSAKVSSGALTQDQANAQWQQWWQQTIEPQKTVLNAAQQQVGQEQARLQQEQARANFATAQTAGQQAVQAQQALLPYMHGPGWANAVQQMASGWEPGKIGTPDKIDVNAALNYTAPDYNAISQKAVADALAHISPAAVAAGGTPQPQFMQQAQGMDINSMLNQTNYTPTFGAPPPGAPPAAAQPIGANANANAPSTPTPFGAIGANPWGTAASMSGQPVGTFANAGAPQTLMPLGAIGANPWSNYVPS